MSSIQRFTQLNRNTLESFMLRIHAYGTQLITRTLLDERQMAEFPVPWLVAKRVRRFSSLNMAALARSCSRAGAISARWFARSDSSAARSVARSA